MARYEHLPIFRDAYDLAVHIERIVRNFSRYHKYTLDADLRNKSREILEKIVKANSTKERLPLLLRSHFEKATIVSQFSPFCAGLKGKDTC